MLRRELAENFSLFQMMWLFCLQQVGESLHGIEQMLSLVQHHTLRPVAHGCVGDFRSRR